MPVRPATKDDIPVLASIMAAAFGPDRLFQVMFPHRAEHPEGFIQAFRETVWSGWYDYKKVLMLSYEVSNEHQDPEPGERDPLLSKRSAGEGAREIITGFAEWERLGKGWEHVHGVYGSWDPRLLMKPLLSAFYALRRRVVPNKAAARPTPEDPHPLAQWNFISRILPYAASFFSEPHRQTHWSLEILAVHPDYHGKGYGRELVNYGLERAKSDPEGDLPVCVVAAEGKEGFYLKSGFKEIVGWMSQTVGSDGSDNPMRERGIGGGAVLWTK